MLCSRHPLAEICRTKHLVVAVLSVVFTFAICFELAAAQQTDSMATRPQPVMDKAGHDTGPTLSAAHTGLSETALRQEGRPNRVVDSRPTPFGAAALERGDALLVHLSRWMARLGLERSIFANSPLHVLHCCWLD